MGVVQSLAFVGFVESGSWVVDRKEPHMRGTTETKLLFPRRVARYRFKVWQSWSVQSWYILLRKTTGPHSKPPTPNVRAQ